MTIPEHPPVGSGPLGGDPLATPGARPIPTTEPTAGGPPAGAGTPPAQRHRARTAGVSLALALLVFVTVVLVLFVVFNTRTVPVSLVFGDVNLPLIVALLLAAVLGALLVLLATFVTRARAGRRE